MRMVSAFMFISFMIGASGGTAQDVCPLAPNVGITARIRVQAPRVFYKALKGRVVGCDEDSLVLSLDRKAARREIPFETIETLEIHRGKRRAAGKGALIGSVSMGLIFGLVASSNFCINECRSLSFGDGVKAVLAGGVVGGLLGGAIGSAFRKDHWERVDFQVPQIQVTVLGCNKGAGLVFSVRF